MENQIEETMKRAFYDLIEVNTNPANPDYDWIVSLYKEIKMMLMRFLKKDSAVYNEIDKSFDVELFEQMIRADVFSPESMYKLIETTYYWIKNWRKKDRWKRQILKPLGLCCYCLNTWLSILLWFFFFNQSKFSTGLSSY